MGKAVGRIIEVKGLSIKAKLLELLPPYLITNGERETAPKINGFVKTKVGIESIICQVVGEYSEEINGRVDSHYLELQVRGHLSNGKFIQGLRMLPIVSASIEILDKEDYDFIYNSGSNRTLNIGLDLFDENKEINVCIDKLIPSHLGVFGNTGSGKSNTLVKILKEYQSVLLKKETNRGKFVVFDINNEYSKDSICTKKNKVIYHLRTRNDSDKKIPLHLASLSEDDFIVLMNASEKTQVPAIKNAYRWSNLNGGEEQREIKYYLDRIKSVLINGKRTLFFSMRHYLSKYFENISEFKFHTSQGVFFIDTEDGRIYSTQNLFNEALNNINLHIPDDPLDRFIFELYFSIAQENENGVQLDFMMPLISRATKLISDFRKIFEFSKKEIGKSAIFENKNVCIIQLGDVNKDMKEIIPSIIANNIFNTLAKTKDEKEEIVQIINIVIDEAHNILYEENGQTISHKNVLDVFERIVKEGRKFGCFLMLASQRPSDISQTIISQLHNYFIHKLVNPSDIQKIRKAVAYLDDSSLDFITVLAPGECIISGTAFQMPSFIYVSQVEKKFRPNSENVKLVGKNGLFNKGKLKED